VDVYFYRAGEGGGGGVVEEGAAPAAGEEVGRGGFGGGEENGDRVRGGLGGTDGVAAGCGGRVVFDEVG
jgi:hypothetical protein